jgi:hypothetical protein
LTIGLLLLELLSTTAGSADNCNFELPFHQGDDDDAVENTRCRFASRAAEDVKAIMETGDATANTTNKIGDSIFMINQLAMVTPQPPGYCATAILILCLLHCKQSMILACHRGVSPTMPSHPTTERPSSELEPQMRTVEIQHTFQQLL